MNYKVLSLKWRPQTFNEVVGQKHITQSLENALKLDRISHAYTFCGPRGVGKTTTARILAKELNNIDYIDNNFDIFEMDGASNRGIDEIRTLRENVKILPINGKYKIYIIDEVHMLTKEAFNALLKTLEEPPEYVIFILATTDPYRLPPTILSRTQRYDFKRISTNDIVGQLKHILDKEKIKYELPSLELIAYKADGSMRDALSYLDQVINYCNNNLLVHEVELSLGIVNDKFYFQLLKCIYDKNSSEIISMINESFDIGVSINDFILGFNRYLKNILFCVIKKDFDTNEDLSNWFKENKNYVSELSLIRIMESLLKLESQLKYINTPDIALEILMVKIANYDNIVDISTLIQKSTIPKKKIEIKNTSNNVQNNNNQISIKKIVSDNKEDIANNNENDNKHSVEEKNEKINKEIVSDNLGVILSRLSKKNAKTAHFLEGCKVLELEGCTIILEIRNLNQFIYNTLYKDIEIIKETFCSVLQTDCSIKINKNFKKSKIENIDKKNNTVDNEHPLLMDALNKFKGEVIK